MLKISDHLSLPVDLVTLTQAIIAKKGAGKSYCASVQAEEMLKARQQIVVLDPTGAWFGIRSSADGKSDGFPVHVIGGEHADVPLEDSAGEIVAEAIIENRFSAIIDLNMLRKAQLRRFVTPFLETLYRLNREPLHLFVDEADDIAPQKPFGDEAAMLGALEDVVKRGRRKGIGCTLITQRPADLAKQVLTQCDALMSLRLSHPRDIDAIEEWVNVHADQKQAKEMIDSLPSLPTGTGWFWCPLWDIFKKIGIRERTTFDSSATPKVGEKARTPKRLAEVDKQMLGEKIAASVQRVKENDPKELRRRLVAAELQLKVQAVPEIKEKIVDRPVLKDEQIRQLDSIVAKLDAKSGDLIAFGEVLSRRATEIRASLAMAKQSPPPITRHAPPPARSLPTMRPSVTAPAGSGSVEVGKSGLRRILIALAQRNGLTNGQIGVRAGLSSTTGTFSTYMSRARSNGWITDQGDRRFITDAGMAVIGDYDPLPTGRALLDHWLRELGSSGASRILNALAGAYPDSMSNEQVGIASGLSHTTGTFSTYMSRLRTLELIEGRGDVRASAELFD
jgi:hypothetical protein